MARNAALNEVRRQGRSAEYSDGELPEVEDSSLIPADDWLCNAEDSAAIARCIEELQPDQRRTIRQAYFEGFSHTELAERASKPLGTIKSWIRRGLTQLKGCLGG